MRTYPAGRRAAIVAMAAMIFNLGAAERAQAAKFLGLGDLAGGSFSSNAFAVSADGSVVVGGSQSASGSEAFRWTSGGGMVGLGDLAEGSFFSSANGVSADGSVVVGGGSSAAGGEAFRWMSGPRRSDGRILQQPSVRRLSRWVSDRGERHPGVWGRGVSLDERQRHGRSRRSRGQIVL
jgi:probable HAF family extracellular repeat protein